MDAASNNSVEDIRSIRDEVNFLPAVAKYRVYIIDEVHMLSTGAFNALLKTLEEPPKHVKFILATTEPQKLPATILSRCQRFDFKRISNDDIVKRLKIICQEVDCKISDGALNMIAVLSEGAMRDSISILERCIQDSDGNLIDENIIRNLVGIPSLDYISRISEALVKKDSESIIKISDEVIKEGKDLDNFLWEIIKYIKDVLVFKVGGSLELYGENDLTVISNISNSADNASLLKIIYDLSKLANEMKTSTQKNIVFEAGILRECFDALINSNQPQNINQIIEVKHSKNLPKENTSTIKPKSTKEKVARVEPLDESSNSKALECWPSILDKLKSSGKMMLYANLIGTTAYQVNDLTIEILFSKKITEFAKKVLEEQENRDLITKLISKELGNVMNIKYIDSSEGKIKKAKDKANEIQELAKDLDIPFNVIDN